MSGSSWLWSSDPVLDRIVGWKGGTEVYALDLEKLEWEKVEAAKWPKAKAEPVLKDGLKTQRGAAAEAIKKALAGLE